MDIPTVPATFSADELRRVLDGQWAQLRDQVRVSIDKAIAEHPETVATGADQDIETQRKLVLEQLQLLADSGLARLGFPKEVGGSGDYAGSSVALEMLAGNLSLMVKGGVQWGLFGGAVTSLGTARHHQKYLPGAMDLSYLGCFAMTEYGHGSDVQGLRTTATYDPATEEFVIHTPDAAARKEYIGSAARDGNIAAVFAQLITGGENHGVHAFVVPLRDDQGATLPGIHIEDCGPKGGLNGVDNGRITFNQVRVPRVNLLNRYGDVQPDGTYESPIAKRGKRFFVTLGALVRGRITIGGTAGSATKLGLEIALKHAARRRQFDNPVTGEETVLLDYRAHQRKLLPALAKSYAMHFAQNEVTDALDAAARSSADAGLGDKEADRKQRELESRAAGLKAALTWHAVRTLQTCREACGGAGYIAENQLVQLRSDVDIFATFEGDNTILLQLVAKGLLTDYKDQFEDLNMVGMARFLGDQVVETLIERTSVRSVVQRVMDAAPGREENELFNRGWQLKMFAEREKHILGSLARRLRRASGDKAFEVFNNAQDHLLRAAEVHVETQLLEAFVAAIERCRDENTKALLNRVCDLYALSTLEADRGWFLEHDRISSTRSKGLIEAVNGLCSELRPHAIELAEGFGIPRGWVQAPIAVGEIPGEASAASQQNAEENKLEPVARGA